MNKSLKLATGQYVNFLNAGDIFVSSNTLTQVSEKTKLDASKILSGDFFILDENTNENANENKNVNVNKSEVF